jgi:hypothetical protein
MAIIRDNEVYEQRQLELLRDILLAVKDELENADLDFDQVAELTGRIGFAVASTLDGEGGSARPRLAFSASGAQPDDLIVNDRGSYLRELVYSLFAHIFDVIEEEEDDEDDMEYEDYASDDDEMDDDYGDEDDDEPPGRIH